MSAAALARFEKAAQLLPEAERFGGGRAMRRLQRARRSLEGPLPGLLVSPFVGDIRYAIIIAAFAPFVNEIAAAARNFFRPPRVFFGRRRPYYLRGAAQEKTALPA